MFQGILLYTQYNMSYIYIGKHDNVIFSVLIDMFKYLNFNKIVQQKHR